MTRTAVAGAMPTPRGSAFGAVAQPAEAARAASDPRRLVRPAGLEPATTGLEGPPSENGLAPIAPRGLHNFPMEQVRIHVRPKGDQMTLRLFRTHTPIRNEVTHDHRRATPATGLAVNVDIVPFRDHFTHEGERSRHVGATGR